MDNTANKMLDGRYRIEKLLGAGGMANVYKATDMKENRPVAVKVLRAEFMNNADLVRRFKNESKAISVLDHPNIVKVYDINITEKLSYIVMEYVEGITLKDYMNYRKQPLTVKETMHFVRQTLLALQHAHEKGIVHRDVKPQNIMLLQNGSIKVMDFGIARFSRSENQTVTDKAIGSVHYISPEQAKGDVTDAKADIYSVGVMMYEMLSGRLPFDSDSPVSIAIKQIADTATPLRQVNPNVPEGLAAITARAMAKDPRSRYPSAREMLADLEEFRRNPNVKFEYHDANAPLAEEPTRYIDKVVSNTPERRSSGAAGRRPGTRGTAARKKGARPGGKKGKGRLVLPIMAGMAAAFAVGAAILIFVIFRTSGTTLFSNVEDVDLPNFVEMSLEEIQNNPEYASFQFDVRDDYSAEYAEGIVYDQSPKAPKRVKANATVTLYVSKGTQVVNLPDVLGKERYDARDELQNLGLVVTIRIEEREDMAENLVFKVTDAADQELSAGAQLTTGDSVYIYVSREHYDNEVKVPDITNMTLEDAKKLLSSRNLLLGPQTEVYSDAAPGTVVNQNPKADSSLVIGESVSVEVSKGPAPTPEPTPTPTPTPTLTPTPSPSASPSTPPATPVPTPTPSDSSNSDNGNGGTGG